jgi:hypothetical protein
LESIGKLEELGSFKRKKKRRYKRGNEKCVARPKENCCFVCFFRTRNKLKHPRNSQSWVSSKNRKIFDNTWASMFKEEETCTPKAGYAFAEHAPVSVMYFYAGELTIQHEFLNGRIYI